MVVIVYWGFIAKPSGMNSAELWVDISVHGVGLAFIFIDFLFNRHVFKLTHIIFHYAILLLYFGWFLIASETFRSRSNSKWYVYKILNPTIPEAALNYFLMIILATFVFLFAKLLHVGRERFRARYY
ncbi:hypothetical protein ROZALSC1DRAFT_29789, partial [Rozella allomycis CSF55]